VHIPEQILDKESLVCVIDMVGGGVIGDSLGALGATHASNAPFASPFHAANNWGY
jgi:hypothetical protein